jgi:hypothetical protein
LKKGFHGNGLTGQDVLDQVFYLGSVFGLDNLMLFFDIVDLDFGSGSDVFNELGLGICLAFVFGSG